MSYNESYVPPTRGKWIVIATGSVMTTGSHGDYQRGDRDIPAPDPVSKDWSSMASTMWESADDFDRKEAEKLLRGLPCCLIYGDGSASSYHTRFGSWRIMVDLTDNEAESLAAVLPIESSCIGQVFDNELFERDEDVSICTVFPFTRFAELDAMIKHRSNIPSDRDFPREGETSTEWWDRKIRSADAPNWITKRDGD